MADEPLDDSVYQIELDARERAVKEIIAIKSRYPITGETNLLFEFMHQQKVAEGKFMTATLSQNPEFPNAYQIELESFGQIVINGDCEIVDSAGRKVAGRVETKQGEVNNRFIIYTRTLQ